MPGGWHPLTVRWAVPARRLVLPVAPGQLTRADIVLDQTGLRMAAPQTDRAEN